MLVEIAFLQHIDLFPLVGGMCGFGTEYPFNWFCKFLSLFMCAIVCLSNNC